jgi:hypothetical protein
MDSVGLKIAGVFVSYVYHISIFALLVMIVKESGLSLNSNATIALITVLILTAFKPLLDIINDIL